MTSAGFPHSETLGSQLVCQLPEDYRRLQRPSSAPSAKASTNVPLKTFGNTTICRNQDNTLPTTHQQDQVKDPHPSADHHERSWKNFKDARVHYAVLKQRTNPPRRSAPTNTDQSPKDPPDWSGMRPSDPYLPETPATPPSRESRPVASGPNSVLGRPPTADDGHVPTGKPAY